MRLIDADALIIDLMDAGLDQIQMGDYSEVIQVIERQPTVNQWHRVEEELPEKFVNVILANKRGKHYDIDKGWWNGYSFDRCEKGIYRNVTHWMPLPEPPKEDA